MVNILIPLSVLVTMDLLMFLLPVNSGEKISLGITVLLSFTVYMLFIADNLPRTSDDVPIIGNLLRDVVQSFRKICNLVSIQDSLTPSPLFLYCTDFPNLFKVQTS